MVGGGSTGAALARDAALRGLAVALVERHDLASGTSSRSSRLIHGGLRYLAQARLGLVREGLVERGRLLAAAPGLVWRVPFLYPVYDGDPDPLWRVRVGVGLYHLLAAGHSLGRHGRLGAREVLAATPGLRRPGLRGGVSYFDAACHDARLVIALALAARAAGATIVTRCALVTAGGGAAARGAARAGDGEHREVEVEDTLNGRRCGVRARAIVLCCGPWGELLETTPVRLRATRGTHIAVPRHRLPLPCHVALRSPDDGRLAFAMPVGEHTVLGTTDVDDPTPPAAVGPTTEDVAYLLRLAHHAFPEAGLSPADVSGAFAGLRPLVLERRAHSRGDPTRVPRDYVVAGAGPGLWVLVGGKLTNHRRMAEECLDTVLAAPGAPRAGPCRTRNLPLFAGSLQAGRERLSRLGQPAERIDRLAQLYGARLEEVAGALEAEERDQVREGAEGRGGALLAAQVNLAATEEWALALDDVLLRRLAPGPLDLPACVALAPRVAELLGARLGWSREQRAEQVQEFARRVVVEMTAASLGIAPRVSPYPDPSRRSR